MKALKKKKIVKKAGIVHFQGILSSGFTTEVNKRLCWFWTKTDKSILANQCAVFRSGDKATFTLSQMEHFMCTCGLTDL